MHRLVVVGGGSMGEALLGGLLAAGWADAHELAVAETSPGRREVLTRSFPDLHVLDAPAESAGAVVAVKPADTPEACRALAQVGVGRVLSIAAGVPTTVLEDALGEGVPVVRAMPNTPALVGAAASALAPGSSAGDEDVEWAASVLGALGAVVRVSEDRLDAVTGLSGSGPAYVFVVVEALVDAGVLVGLARDVATELAVQTVLGSAMLLKESGRTPAELRAAVTSPGGTTAAGLRELERAGVRAAFMAAVQAATERSVELGG